MKNSLFNEDNPSLPQLLRKRQSARGILTLALLLLTPLVAYSQVSSSTARRVRAGSSLPATCKATNPVDIFIRTGATNPGFYICGSTNTWSGPFSTSTGITNGASNGQVAISNGTNIVGDADLTFATDTLTATKFAGALNGTVGATTPAAGVFTTLSATAPANGSVSLTLKGNGAGQTADLMEVYDTDGTSKRFRLSNKGLIGSRGLWIGAGFAGDSGYDVLFFGQNTAGQNSWGFTSNTAFRGGSAFTFGWASDPNGIGTAADSNVSRISAGVVGAGTGAQGSTAGTFQATKFCYSATVCDWFGSGSPETVIAAGIGSTYRRTDGGAATSFYVKESGAGNTGWVAK